MKIILSKAGGGKTRKAIELAENYLKEEKRVLFVSGELDVQEYLQYAIELNRNIHGAEYAYVENIDEAFEVIKSKPEIDVVLLDEVANRYHLKHNATQYENMKQVLDSLNDLEDDKTFYVTQQDNSNSKLMNDELIVFDYDPERNDRIK